MYLDDFDHLKTSCGILCPYTRREGRIKRLKKKKKKKKKKQTDKEQKMNTQNIQLA